MWHGQNTNVSQIKKKKVGAWPLWFFIIVAYIIYVSNFSFDISLRKKILFLWCHTNTHGIDLRRTPQGGVSTEPGELAHLSFGDKDHDKVMRWYWDFQNISFRIMIVKICTTLQSREQYPRPLQLVHLQEAIATTRGKPSRRRRGAQGARKRSTRGTSEL